MTEVAKHSTKKTAEETPKHKGKYIDAIGRRKTATAQVRLYKNGNGAIDINGLNATEYFSEEDLYAVIIQPLKLTGLMKDFDISVLVSGGGKKGKAEAVRHGIARALLIINPDLRPSLKVKGWITRDARKKERKKPGLKKARRAPQWAKR